MRQHSDGVLGKGVSSRPSFRLARLFSHALTALAVLLAPVAMGVPGPSLTGAPGLSDDALTLEARAEYQRRLEEVYWKHRIWPQENPDPKPPLAAVLSDAAIRERVADYLDKTAALEVLRERPLTGEELQAELHRMARSSRNPDMLRELFAALDDDPLLIAECLARPALVDRLARNWYARDTSESQSERPFDRWWIDEGRTSLAEFWSPDAGAVPAPEGGYELLPPPESACTDDTWTPTSTGAGARRYHTAVWTGTEMIVWGGRDDAGYLNTGGRYNPATDTWTPTSTGANVPSTRILHKTVWTGTEMIVWGGWDAAASLDTGGRYNPTNNTWAPTSTGANLPPGSNYHTAVWTGTEMIVWGGQDAVGPVNTGGRYNPADDTWTLTSTGTGVPSARLAHTAVSTGTEMIIWGGQDSAALDTGARYDLTTGTWTPTSTGANAPSRRTNHTAAWTGTEMIVWGGQDGSFLPVVGGRYNPAAGTWTATSGAPQGRLYFPGVWTGSELIVWGGWIAPNVWSTTGSRYDLATDSWTATSTAAGVPSERRFHTAVWTGTEMIVWGGIDQTTSLDTGGRYCACTPEDWWPDCDGDGTGDLSETPVAACDEPPSCGAGACACVNDQSDCDDANPSCTTDCTDADSDGWCVTHDCDDTAPTCDIDCTDGDQDGLRACDGDCDDANADCTTDCTDADSDGYCVTTDCDDTNAHCTTDCTDADADGWCVTHDCDDTVSTCGADCTDGDQDGLRACDGDCDDGNPNCTTDCTDTDSDGYCVTTDCDDGNANCTTDCTDADADGWCVTQDCDDANANCTTDCTDADSDTYCVTTDCDDAKPNCTTDCTDLDSDGYCGTTDCDDQDADCAVDCTDGDQDGLRACDGDCDDANGQCTTDCTDADSDTYCVTTDCDDSNPNCTTDCTNADSDGYCVTTDCDDGDSAVYPGAPQICDGLNNDCDDPAWPDLAGWAENVVDVWSSAHPRSVVAADLDGDEDLDVLANMGGVVWYENLDGAGSFGPRQLISAHLASAWRVAAADLDGDGDMDALSAGLFDDKIAWYENTAGDGTVWTTHTISILASTPVSVFAMDVDGDENGYLDVVVARWDSNGNGDQLLWYENVAGDGSSWTPRDIWTSSNDRIGSAVGADVDGDGDPDVVGSLSNSFYGVVWHENLLGDGSSWTPHSIGFGRHSSVFAADVNGDTNLDVISAGYDSTIRWHENINGNGVGWTTWTISTSALGVRMVFAADMDADGDMDALSASGGDDRIAWHENTAGDGSAWTMHTISLAADDAYSVFAADVNHDGYMDALATSDGDDKIAWHDPIGHDTNEFDHDGDSYTECSGDCDDQDADCTTDCTDGDQDGLRACNGDCDDANPNCTTDCTNADADAYCITTDCDDTNAQCTTDCTDADSDAYCVTSDCDDQEDDCTTDCTDADADGLRACDGDCDDLNAQCGIDCTDADLDAYCLTTDCNDANPNCTTDCTDADSDTYCVTADCDDVDPDRHPEAAEVNDGEDNQCEGDRGYGIVDEISGNSGYINPANPEECSWTAQEGATRYQVARSGQPDFSSDCMTYETPETYWSDPEIPAGGEAFHYVIRSVAPWVGSWGMDSEGQERVFVCGNESLCDDQFDNDDDGLIDCLDEDCDGIDGCEVGAEITCDDSVDNDADGLVDCLDPDCNGIDGCELGTEITCGDSQDNDADGLADCLDPDCHGIAGCEFGTEVTCGDSQDNDADGLADCLDPDCDGIAGCEFGAEVTCDDSLDNDADGLADCLDPGCNGINGCELGTELTCDDSQDNDADGLIDCLDPDCNGIAGCELGTEVTCDDSLDNDADGPADCLDPDCNGIAGCELGTEATCDDSLDNDADGLTDCQDPDCDGIGTCELGTEVTCDDTLDNDGDGLADCLDPDCDFIGSCEYGWEYTCDDGLDNDADGAPDCYDDDCHQYYPECYGYGMFAFLDTDGDDIGDADLRDFFQSLTLPPPVPPLFLSHYIFFEMSNDEETWAWCSEEAHTYRDWYLTYDTSPAGGETMTEGWDRWVRSPLTSDQWVGPLAGDGINRYGWRCNTPYSWCLEDYFEFHDKRIDPVAPNEDEAGYIYIGVPVEFVKIKIAPTRSEACGF